MATSTTVAAAAAPITSGPNLFSSPVALRSAEGNELRIVFLYDFYNGVIFQGLVVGASDDEGETWTFGNGPGGDNTSGTLRVPTYQAGSPSLLQLASSDYVLFYHYGFNFDFHLRRSPSSDGMTYSTGTILDMGWSSGVEDQPRVIADGAGELTMIYRRQFAEGPSVAGIYLSRSVDEGVSWDSLHTLASAQGYQADLAYRASDGLYLLSYLVDDVGGGYEIYVKTTQNPRDWSAPARQLASGSVGAPRIARMSDGAFVMVWSRGDGAQSHIVMSRSVDGLDWSPEVTVAGSPTLVDAGPFALAGSSPGVIDLYWSALYEDGSTFTSQIYRDSAVVVLDPVFAGGFDP